MPKSDIEILHNWIRNEEKSTVLVNVDPETFLQFHVYCLPPTDIQVSVKLLKRSDLSVLQETNMPLSNFRLHLDFSQGAGFWMFLPEGQSSELPKEAWNQIDMWLRGSK